jgi:hypothetical protein
VATAGGRPGDCRSGRPGGDFPWLKARVVPREGFEEIRPIFEVELRLVEDEKNIGPWEEAYHRLGAEVLAAPDGHLVPEFLLHIDGSEAWRWSEEPFEDEKGSTTTT